jgi:hypothetical protein
LIWAATKMMIDTQAEHEQLVDEFDRLKDEVSDAKSRPDYRGGRAQARELEMEAMRKTMAAAEQKRDVRRVGGSFSSRGCPNQEI